MNFFEETDIKNDDLPDQWQDHLVELESFLQQNWSERKALYDDGNKKSKQCFVTFLRNNGIRTNNYVGTICFNGVQVNILPKVFRQTADDNQADDISEKLLFDNIARWIWYCEKRSFPYLKLESENIEEVDSLLELLITLYVLHVKYAFNRSSYFQYEAVSEENSPVIKGKFNVVDYVLNKLPAGNAARFACDYSEFQFDNKLNRIVKNVCQKLINKTKLPKNKSTIQKILFRLDDVADEQCTPYDCDRIHINRFHKHYENVLSLSKIFLMNESTNYLLGTKNSFCFLFPSEVLFEDYIAGMFKKLYGSKIKTQDPVPTFYQTYYGKKSIQNDLTARMDIVYEDKDRNKVIVLDTKYKIIPRLSDIKKFTETNIASSDLYQILTYAILKDCTEVYLLYPLLRNEDMEEDNILCEVKNADKIRKDGVKIHIARLPFVVDENTNTTKEQLGKIISEIAGEQKQDA